MTGKKRCQKCDSTQTRYLRKTSEYRCYVCGHTWKEAGGEE